MGTQTITYTRKSPFPNHVTPAVLKTMHEIDKKSLQEIADEFKTNKQTVLNWIKRARIIDHDQAIEKVKAAMNTPPVTP